MDQALAIRRSRHTSTSLTETAVSNPGLGDEIGLDRAPEETSTCGWEPDHELLPDGSEDLIAEADLEPDEDLARGR